MKKQINIARGVGKIAFSCFGIFAASLMFFACGGSDGVNGTNGTNASIQTTPEPAGEHCLNGGIKIEVLQDGVVQGEQTQYICNPSNGTNGTNGTNASIQTSDEPAGYNCPNGGIKIEVFIDNVVQDEQTKYICNGIDGRDGNDGFKEVQFISIPAGTMKPWLYGSVYGDPVDIPPFSLTKTPITVAQYQKCLAAGVCSPEHLLKDNTSDAENSIYCNLVNSRDNHPMNCVDWYGAKEYCEWIGGRLPTQEEWRYAATHDGTQHLETKYPWGDSEPKHCVTANYTVRNTAADGTESFIYCNERKETSEMSGTSPVGLYSPAGDSPLGLVDMSGNVQEWTATRDQSTQSCPQYNTDPCYRLSGGHWGQYQNFIYANFTFANRSKTVSTRNGFRCARDEEE